MFLKDGRRRIPRYPQTHAGFGQATYAASGKPGGAQTMAQEKKVPQKTGVRKIKHNNKLDTIFGGQPGSPQQAVLDLRIEKQVHRDGIDMGAYVST